MSCHGRPFRWQDRDIIKFLKQYKRLECLWNPKHHDYKVKNKRLKALQEMKDNLGFDNLTVYDVRSKIKSIRTKFCEEMRKIKNSQISGSNDYSPRVFWFPLADTFLRNVTESREPLDQAYSLTKNYASDQEETFEQEEEQTEASFDEDQKLASPDPLENHYKGYSKTRNYPSNKEVIASTSGSNMEVNKEEDEFDLFGRSMAIQLKKLPELDALELMQKFQLMVYNKKQQLQSNYQH